MEKFSVSLFVVAYNEQSCISALLEDIVNQTYPKKLTEIILVDSASEDKTKEIFEKFREDHGYDYAAVQVLDNPKRRQSAGCNVAIRAARGDIIIRVDGHAEIPPEFIEKNVLHHQEGEFVTGGARPNIIDEDTPYKRTLLMAESSMFGSSIAGFRRKVEKSYVKSIFHGAVRREVFEKAGIYNEGLGRTEDNELYWRISQAGYKICLYPDIVSYQQTRSSLKTMLKQKYGNGYWIGRTLAICPGCISLYHFAPFVFVLGCIAALLLWLWSWIFPVLYFGAYALAAIGMAVLAIVSAEKKDPVNLILPFLFFLLHFSYGIGTVAGLVGLIFKRPTKQETTTERL